MLLAFEYMRHKAVWRLQCDWDKTNGWAEPISKFDLTYRGGKQLCTSWDFNGCDMDQGLFTHYFLLHAGNTVLLDTEAKLARVFAEGLVHGPDRKVSMRECLAVCGGAEPTSFFAHFTGRSKPWMLQPEAAAALAVQKFGTKNIKTLMRLLDSLQLPVNSTTVLKLGLGSPLGFFNANFPKKNRLCVSDKEVP